MVYSDAAYQVLVQDIFRRFPSVQKDGFSAGAYKPGLERMQAFEEALGHPSRQFRSIHIAGTNGKGSVANMLASALSSCGLKTGLFTSPHLLDFRERMVIGPCHSERSEESLLIPKEYVFSFLTRWMSWITEHGLSFFEITTGLAFSWFAHEKVSVAVIETGLGGRLDSTNILERPDLAIVTTIGFDHMALLGNTLPAIAAEKAGIFKADVPALVGEWQADTAPVFEAASAQVCFADRLEPSLWPRHKAVLAAMDLQADVQQKNLRTVLAAVDILRQHPGYAALSDDEALLRGIVHTARRMGFHGRWERLQESPCVIADIGHNAHALQHNFAQLEARAAHGLIIVYGIMADKDLDAILPLMPRSATYIFTTPDTPRALPGQEILRRFTAARSASPENSVPLCSTPAPPTVSGAPSGLVSSGPLPLYLSGGGQVSGDALLAASVPEAVKLALTLATPDTMIYIGGSTFVVADALPLFNLTLV